MFLEGRQERYQILTLNVIKYLINTGTIILKFCFKAVYGVSIYRYGFIYS